ncbi:hypothetical protein ABZ468_20235 [Streptomyces sp. NPDC005708]
MANNKSVVRRLGRAALFSLVRGACWAAGSALAAAIAWWMQRR